MTQMKRIYGIIAALFLVGCLLFAGCTGQEAGANETATPTATTTTTAPAEERVFTMDDNGATATVSPGTGFTIQLDENPTTGYEWNATYSDNLNLINDTFVPPDTQLVGAGGVRMWQFEATGVGTGNFTAIYKRPWEAATGNETTFSMMFDIK
jgi:inhibitor of cysteine peptidase